MFSPKKNIAPVEIGFGFQLSRSLKTLLFCIPLSFSLCGQTASDSLEQALETAQGIERAKLLLELSSQTRQKDPEAAIVQAREALQIATRSENGGLRSKSLQKLGFYNSMIDRDTTALEYFLGALKLNRQLGRRLAEADVLQSLGRFYMNQGNHPKALDYFFQALRIFRDKGDKDHTANVLSYIGDIHRQRGETERAASYFKQSTTLGRETNNFRQISISAVKAANMLHQLGKFEEATRYFDLALAAAVEMKSIHAQAGILLVMSSAYQDKNLYDKALKLNKRLLKIAQNKNNKILLARGYENLAGIYAAKGNLTQANEYFVKARQFYEEVQFPTLPVTQKLMQVLLKQNRPEEAIKTGEKALAKKQGTASLQAQKKLLESLAEAYKKQRDYQNALKAKNQIIVLAKKIYDTEKAEQIAEMQTRFETEQKEQEIKLLEKESEKATLLRNALFAGILMLAIIALLFFNRQRLKMRKNRTDMENTLLKDKQLEQDLEFKNKQLTTHSLNLVQKNEVMKELKERIGELQKKSDGKENRNLKSIKHLIDYSFNLDKDWEEFKHYFEEVHSGFFESLKTHAPDLTSNELRLSALVKLNLTIKEISSLLAISPDSVKTARYRLRKKLGLETEDNLSGFLNQIEQKSTSAS